MIIAPLIRPIMATTARLVMGDLKRTARSLGIVIISVIGVVLALLGLNRANVQGLEGRIRRVKVFDDRIDLEIYGSGEQAVYRSQATS